MGMMVISVDEYENLIGVASFRENTIKALITGRWFSTEQILRMLGANEEAEKLRKFTADLIAEKNEAEVIRR